MQFDAILSPPSKEHLMGTDSLGRDIFSRILYGGRTSISIALLSVFLSFIVGTPLGSISGFIGGKLDRILSIIMDSLYAFPVIILALLIATMLGPGISNTSIAIAAASVPSYYRVIRSITLSLKERTFIEAEKSMGASDRYIILHHILPHSMSEIIVLMTFGMADAILSVAGLGFIGLGIPPPTPEWGTDLSGGREVLLVGAWWVTTFPGLIIFATILGFNLLGEGLPKITSSK